MKRVKFLSHLKMRVIPMMMVSTLLCSNFVSINALAESESTEATSEDTANGEKPADESTDDSKGTENSSQDESSDEAATGDTSESDDALEGSDDSSDEASTEASGEASEGDSSDDAVGDASTEATSEEEEAADEASSEESLDEDLLAESKLASTNALASPSLELQFSDIDITIDAPDEANFELKTNIRKITPVTENGVTTDYVDYTYATVSSNGTYHVLNSNYFAFDFTVSELYYVEIEYDGETYPYEGSDTFEVYDSVGEANAIKVTAIKKDSTEPVISNVVVPKPTVGEYIFSDKANDLVFKADVVDKGTDNRAASGVDKVYVLSGNDKYLMTKDAKSNTYSWMPDKMGIYTINGIKAIDKSNNEKVYEMDCTIYYQNQLDDYLGLSMKNGDIWYTTANSSTESFAKRPVLYIRGTSGNAIESITIKCGDDKDTIPEDNFSLEVLPNGYLYKLDYDLSDLCKEGDNKIEVFAEYHDDDDPEPYYIISDINVKIDSTAPNATVTYNLYNAKGNKLSHDAKSGWDNELGIYVVNGDVYAIPTITLVEPEAEATPVEESEIAYYTYYTDWESNKKLGSGNKIKFLKRDNQEHYVKGIKVVDKAGNSTYIEMASDHVIFDDDKPKIEYEYNTSIVVDNTRYYRDVDATGSIYIKDNYALNTADGKTIITKDNADIGKLTSKQLNKSLIGKRCWQMIYSFNISLADESEDEFFITTTAEDLSKDPEEQAINVTTEQSNKIVIDKKAPTIDVQCDNSFVTKGDFQHTKGTVVIKISVSEKYPDIEAIEGAISVARLSNFDSSESGSSVSPEWTWDENGGTCTFTISEEGAYEFILNADCAKDIVGHGAKVTGKELSRFIVNTGDPELTVDFDNNQAVNGKYYNKARTATITVKDISFDESTSVINIQSKYGSVTTPSFTGDDGVYTATIEFNQDGIYSFTVTAYDIFGTEKTETVEEFVIDTTEPKVNVTYTNNDAMNQMYYNKARVATLDIEDLTFDADLVEYGMQPISDGSQLPSIGSFSTSDLNNTAYMTFDQDGKYAYVINCTDLAGNTATSYISDVFVIDTIAPEVNFSGVENYSANNGTVAPTVKYVDKNMDMEATVVTMTGSNNGPVAVGNAVTETEDGFVVSYDDFAHDKSMDDLYTLTAKVYDLAGNESEEELVFSVNRYGSVFVLGDAAKVLNEEYYTNDPKDITITEINVDELTYRDISISCDGDITELTKGSDYTVTAQGSDTTWKTYTYTLGSENFTKDGVYSVTVYTKDRASNTQDNKSRDAEINFAVDMTKPSIVTTGIESNTTYNKSSIGVNINVADNMGLTTFDIFRGEKHVGSYTAEELEQNGGTIALTLEEADKEPFDLKLVAVDVAGNEEVLTYSNVTVAVETTEIIDPPVPPVGPDPKPSNNNVIIFIIIGFGVIALASGAGIFAYQNKKKSE